MFARLRYLAGNFAVALKNENDANVRRFSFFNCIDMRDKCCMLYVVCCMQHVTK